MDFVTVYFGDASTVKGSESVAGACPFPEKTGIKSTVEPGGVVPFGKWTQNEIVPELAKGPYLLRLDSKQNSFASRLILH